MGSCISKKQQNTIRFISSNSTQHTKASNVTLYPPPLLQRKELNSTNVSHPSLKSKSEIIDYLCSLKLNHLLKSKENILNLVLSLISKYNIEKETICELAGDFFDRIYAEEKEVRNYNKPKIMKKIFEEYYLCLYKQYSSVINGNAKTLFFLIDYNFSLKMICEATEIYQILLSHKQIINKKKLNKKKIIFWWLEPLDDVLLTSNYTMIDTFIYLKDKFTSLAKEILLHYTSIIAEYDESKTVRLSEEQSKSPLFKNL